MPVLSDLFDMELFEEMKGVGFIKVQRHPDFPDELAIANYTHKAQRNYHWNEVTEQCRGLIFHPGTQEVLKRPFRKFFNYDEPQAAKIQGHEDVRAFDKMDGSLGIIYRMPNGMLGVATRGSFTSEQAVWATQWLQNHEAYARMDDRTWDEITDMFEIIYPENRIVVTYPFEGLVYLNSIDNRDGSTLHDPDTWSMLRSAECLYEGPFNALFNVPERQNAEGYVVQAFGGRRVKVKYEEYVKVHRVVSNLTPRYVHEYMGGPNPLRMQELMRSVPEEHAKWVKDVGEELTLMYVLCASYMSELTYRTKNLETRKEKALYVKDEPAWVKGAFFRTLDKKPFMDVIWKALGDSMKEKEGAKDDN